MDAQTPQPQGRKLFYGLFLFPLLIAAGMAILLCTVVFLTHEEQNPETLITAIKTGSPSKRWQKAFELSNELNRSAENLRQTGLINIIKAGGIIGINFNTGRSRQNRCINWVSKQREHGVIRPPTYQCYQLQLGKWPLVFINLHLIAFSFKQINTGVRYWSSY
jgi:hypothetical protein